MLFVGLSGSWEMGSLFPATLVPQGCSKRMLRMGGAACKQHAFPPTGSRGRKSRIRVPADLVSDEGPLPGVDRCPLAVPHVVVVGGRRSFQALLHEGAVPIRKGSALMASHLPRGSPPNTITSGLRFQHVNFRGTHTFSLGHLLTMTFQGEAQWPQGLKKQAHGPGTQGAGCTGHPGEQVGRGYGGAPRP